MEVGVVLTHGLLTEVALDLEGDAWFELVEDALGGAAVHEQEVTFGATGTLHAKVVITGCAPSEVGLVELSGAVFALAEFLCFRH